MTRPTRLQIGPHRYAVTWTDDVKISAELAVPKSDATVTDGAYGASHHRANIMLIGTDMAPSQQADTLLHEALHCMLVQIGADNERLVWRLTPVLLDFIRRNPRAVEFLTAKENL